MTAELLAQLKAQNQLLRNECKAAEDADKALNTWLNEGDEKKAAKNWQRYTRLWRAWQEAIKARKATEPPF